MDPAAEPRAPRSALTVPTALLAAYSIPVIWTFVGESNAWPHVGSVSSIVFVLFCPGILFQAARLIFRWRTGRKLRGLVRLATIPAGVLLGVALSGWASNRAMAGFRRAYAPFVAEIGAHLADPCAAATRAFALPAVAAYNAQTGSESPLGKLSYDSKRFVLSFGGGSADIDGSTIFFDSNTAAWDIVHNNNLVRSTHEHLVQELAECTVSAEPR